MLISEKEKRTEWLLCPVCKRKTRLKLREDTELKNFLLFCPKCKNQKLINVKSFVIEIIEDNIVRR